MANGTPVDFPGPSGTVMNPKRSGDSARKGDIFYHSLNKSYYQARFSQDPKAPLVPMPFILEDTEDWYHLGAIGAGTATWMSNIPNDTYLSQMSIPGTHETFTYKTEINWGEDVECQELRIGDQLNLGIRFVDLRCHCGKRGDLEIHHGSISMRITAQEALQECLNFVIAHKSEFVIARIKQEDSSASNQLFKAAFNKVINSIGIQHFYTAQEIPQAGAVRGKIVILANVAGLDGIPWPDLTTEDHYKDIDENFKEIRVKNNMVGSVRAHNGLTPGPGPLYITFTSKEGRLRHDAGVMNVAICTFLSSMPLSPGPARCSLGLIAMNFPTRETIREIIKCNDHKLLRHGVPVTLNNLQYHVPLTVDPRYDWRPEDADYNFNFAYGETSDDDGNGQFKYWMIFGVGDDAGVIYNTGSRELLRTLTTRKTGASVGCDADGVLYNDNPFIWQLRFNGVGYGDKLCYLLIEPMHSKCAVMFLGTESAMGARHYLTVFEYNGHSLPDCIYFYIQEAQ